MQQKVFRHYKGDLYTVLFVALCSDNGPNEDREVVVYISHKTGRVSTRFKDDFLGMVDCHGDGEVIKRQRFKEVPSYPG